MLADGVGSCFVSDLVTLSGGELASVEIDLPIPDDEADHLVVRGRDDFHTM